MQISVLEVRMLVTVPLRSLAPPLVGEILAGRVADPRPLAALDLVDVLLDPATVRTAEFVIAY
jgi:hypothetical protein